MKAPNGALSSRSVTLADVAARANVSSKTVSRVVNNDAAVRQQTRDHVLAAIRELNFKPNLAARSLAAARSFMIGVVAPSVDASYYYRIYRGAARACQARGYHLVLEEFDHGAESAADFYERHLKLTRYDGVLLPPPVCDEESLLTALDRDGVTYARISPAFEPDRSPSVFADDAAGVHALVEHLWAGGHRSFGLITGTPNHAATSDRRNAFLDAITRLGGQREDVIVVELGFDTSIIAAARVAAEDLLSRAQKPTAVFCFNDEIAASVIALAHQRGLRVPEDIAVAGFDDAEFAQFMWPALTTIRQPIDRMAETAVTALVDGTADDATMPRCGVELVVRNSTSPRRREES